MQGTVKFFNPTKGYGFIEPDEAHPDVFVHISAVEKSGLHTLQDGQRVSFDKVPSRKPGKDQAENLSVTG